MNNEDLPYVVQSIIDLASRQKGVTAAAAGGSLNEGLNVSVRLGEVETIEFNRDKSLGIVVYKDQRKGSASITDLSKEAIAAAVEAACRIADYTEPDPYSGLAPTELLATNIPDLDLAHPANISAEQAIEYARECEAAALGVDKRITNSEGAGFYTNAQYYVYGNTDGFLAGYPVTRYSANCVVIGKHGDSMQRDYDYTVARDMHELTSLKKVGIKAAEKTLARLGARKIKTCSAPVLFMPNVAVSLWSCLTSAISGGSLYRKSSFLLDKLQHKIFPEFVNIVEEPHILKALGSAPFDDEGVATNKKEIISTGVLKTYLLSSYSARRLGMQTTGNSGGVHNLIIKPGIDDFNQLVKKMHKGLIVTQLMGNGTNIVTGDYSHGAAGFWVENGEIAYPVEEITIASNLAYMFKNILAIGNDIDRRTSTLTGSVLINNMTIAGV